MTKKILRQYFVSCVGGCAPKTMHISFSSQHFRMSFLWLRLMTSFLSGLPAMIPPKNTEVMAK